MNPPHDIVFELYDQALAPAQQREAERHVAGCSACRQTLEAWTQTANLFSRVPRVSGSFTAEVMQRIAREPVPGMAGWRLWFTWPRLTLAGVTAAAAAAFLMTRAPTSRFSFAEAETPLQYAAALIDDSENAGEEGGAEEPLETYFL